MSISLFLGVRLRVMSISYVVELMSHLVFVFPNEPLYKPNHKPCFNSESTLHQ